MGFGACGHAAVAERRQAMLRMPRSCAGPGLGAFVSWRSNGLQWLNTRGHPTLCPWPRPVRLDHQTQPAAHLLVRASPIQGRWSCARAAVALPLLILAAMAICDGVGARVGIRTLNLGIKSPLLCQIELHGHLAVHHGHQPWLDTAVFILRIPTSSWSQNGSDGMTPAPAMKTSSGRTPTNVRR